ncbi:hypothetical protein K439DRAFT_427581 [Ramaria rubella]|nr:hypothetical protein K439DRAFT_427581 [Ramaria rubella]
MDSAVTTQVMQSPTILRIKRKRTDEPLDALVVESKSRRKKSRGGSGFFQFAETVEEDTFWQDPNQTKDLRSRISTLASGEFTPEKSEREVKTQQATPGRRYTIVKNGSEKGSPRPPVVQTASQSKPVLSEEDFAMFDAVPEPTIEPIDPEMDKFLPMLQEYLRMNNEPSNIASTSAKVKEDSEYVWDVFYHRPAITDWAASANVATVSGLPPIGQYDSESDSASGGDEDDEDSNTEDFYRNDYPDEDPDQNSDESGDLSVLLGIPDTTAHIHGIVHRVEIRRSRNYFMSHLW